MSSSLKIGPFVVHPDLNQIVRSGENVRVEPQVMKLLVFMSENPGELLSHKQIHHAVWDGTAVSDDALKRAIRVLRKTLGDDANDPRFIETLPKKGYRLIAPVSIVRRSRIGIETTFTWTAIYSGTLARSKCDSGLALHSARCAGTSSYQPPHCGGSSIR